MIVTLRGHFDPRQLGLFDLLRDRLTVGAQACDMGADSLACTPNTPELGDYGVATRDEALYVS
jgi:hypothetical protein